MADTLPTLPPDADAAVDIVQKLRAAGHEAMLAGGCVRDLLLGAAPQDFDVATSAPPDRVCTLFRPTRKVGAAFGVVLVRSIGKWIEVATFRTDGDYRDGRRPESVTFTDARHDALRRDFTVNGMFLDPLDSRVIDYVGGRDDLAARRIRAIGDPAARFAEDHLRLLRAIRFAARLGFSLEPLTAAEIQRHAARLRDVAPERVREELLKMLAHPNRAAAIELGAHVGLLPHLWPRHGLPPHAPADSLTILNGLPPDVANPFELSLAILLAERSIKQVEEVTRDLRMSNGERDTVAWLVRHQAALDDPAKPSLAEFKRLLAHQAFPALRAWADVRLNVNQQPERALTLAERIAAIPAQSIAPPPFITGDDLIARQTPPGPLFRRVLDELYTRQLNDEWNTREEALAALDALLRETR